MSHPSGRRHGAARAAGPSSKTRRRASRPAEPTPHPFLELITRLRPEIDRRLDRTVRALSRRTSRHGVEPTVEALRDLIARGGKRFRAGLVVAAFAGVRPRASLEPAIVGAMAFELLHAYLLVQDDWMDRDDTRRGGPSVHAALTRQYGDPTLGDVSAIISSDFGWSLAVQVLAQAPVPAKRVLRALDAFCAAHEDVLIGQQLDVLGRAIDVEAMHSLKTASYTARGPLLVGGALGGAPDATQRALARFAEPLGVAFQLRDDLLGVFADEALTGKPLGSDLREGKRTAVTAAAEARLDRAGRRVLQSVYGRAEVSAERLRTAARHLERCGARAVVQRRLAQLCSLAQRRAKRLPLTEEARLWLRDAAALVAAPVGSPLPGREPRPRGRR